MAQHYSGWHRSADDRYYEPYLEEELLGDGALTQCWGRRASSLGQVATQGYSLLQVAVEWGWMAANSEVPAIAGLMTATAKVNGLVLVTNDAPRVEGIQYLNPFKPKG